MRSIDGVGDWTQISGKTCQNGSRVGETKPLEKAAQTALNAASRLELSQSGDSETLVFADQGNLFLVYKQVSDHLAEKLFL